MDIRDFGPCRAIGVADADELIAGCVYNHYYDHRSGNIEVTLASTSPRWCTRAMLRGLFGYPFIQLGCVRITAVTASGNQSTRTFLRRLVFQQEGVMRRAFHTGEEAVIHGILCAECRWIKAEEIDRYVQGRRRQQQHTSGG